MAAMTITSETIVVAPEIQYTAFNVNILYVVTYAVLTSETSREPGDCKKGGDSHVGRSESIL